MTSILWFRVSSAGKFDRGMTERGREYPVVEVQQFPPRLMVDYLLQEDFIILISLYL